MGSADRSCHYTLLELDMALVLLSKVHVGSTQLSFCVRSREVSLPYKRNRRLKAGGCLATRSRASAWTFEGPRHRPGGNTETKQSTDGSKLRNAGLDQEVGTRTPSPSSLLLTLFHLYDKYV